MRKISLFFSTCLLIAACNVAELEPVNPGNGQTIIGATTELPSDGSDTKSTINKTTGAFAWSAGDSFQVFTLEDGLQKFTLYGEAGQISAYFIGSGDITTAAVFPNTLSPVYSGGTLSVTYPSEIAWVEGEADNYMVAAGFPDEANSIAFKNIGGVIMLTLKNIPAGADHVDVNVYGARITGAYDVDLSDVSQPTVTAETLGEDEFSTVTFTFEQLTAPAKMVFYIPVPCMNYNALGFAVKNSNEDVLVAFKSSTLQRSVSRSDLKIFPSLTLVGASGDGGALSVTVPANYNNGLGGDFALPNTENNVEVHVEENGSNDINLTYYGEGSSEPANISILIEGDVETLTLSLPNSHVELNGSPIGSSDDVVITNLHSNTSLSTLVVGNKTDKLTIGKPEVENSGLTVVGGSLDLQAPVQTLTVAIPEEQVNATKDTVSISVSSSIQNLKVTRAATQEIPDKVFVYIESSASVAEAIDVPEVNCNLYVAPGATANVVSSNASETTVAGTVTTLNATGETTIVTGTVEKLAASGEGTTVVVEKLGSVTESISSTDNASVIIVERTEEEVAAEEAGVITETQSEQTQGVIITVEEEPVAQIGQVAYGSIEAAIEAAAPGANSIKILKDVTVTKGFTIEKDIEIDLNGKTITANAASAEDSNFPNNRLFKVTGTANLTLKNGTTTGNDKIWGSVRFESTGNLVLTNYVTYNSREYGANIKMSHGTATFTNVTINSDKGGCVDIGDGSYDAPSGAVAEMTNCTFNQTGEGSTAEYKTVSTAVIVSCSGHVTLNSGTYSGYHGLFPHNSGGTIIVKEGCTVTGRHDVVCTTNKSSKYSMQEDHFIYIEGGIINGGFSVANDGHSTFRITGGTFDHNPSNYVAIGYEAIDNANGTWTVQSAGYAACIGNETYMTLADAIAAANDAGDVTITLLCDYDFEANDPGYGWTTAYLAEGETETRDNMLEISGNNITFELAGHTISNLFNNTFKVSGTNVTFQNGEMRVGQLYYSNAAGTKIYTSENDKTCSYIMLVAGATNFVVNNLTTYGGINVCEGSTATINDLSFSGTKFYAVCSQENSTVTLNGGTYTKAITGATGNLFWIEAGSKMNITGGTFIKGNADFRNGNVNPVITGGTFDFDPTNFGVAAGYEAVGPTDGKWTVAEVANEARIGSVNYATLVEAIAAVPTTGEATTITILKNITVDVASSPLTIAASKNVVLELNGKEVIGQCASGTTSALITNKGTLTIQDNSDSNSNGCGTGKLVAGADPTWTWDGTDNYSGSYASNLIRNERTLIINSGLLYNASTGSAAYAVDNYNSASLTVNGGKLNTNRASAIRMFYMNGGTTTVTGGIIGSESTYMGLQVMGTNLTHSVTVNISGGTFYARENSYPFYAQCGTSFNLSGGTFEGYVGFGSKINAECVSLTGGVYKEVASWMSDAHFISGGTFYSDPSEYVAPGYEAVDNGDETWTVAEIQGVAKIGETRYATLAAAFAAVESGQTITLLRDVTLTENPFNVTLGEKTVTLDLGTNTLTGRTNLKSGNLTIQNGNVTLADGQPLNVYGSATAGAQNYSVMTVASNVTVTGKYGVCLFGATGGTNGYGAVVNMNGTFNANNGVFVSGNLGNNVADDMHNIVNISGTLTSANDVAVALNGWATVNVLSGAQITGNTGIAVKRGVLNVATGATVAANGEWTTPPAANNSGTEPTGAAVSMTATYNNLGAMAVNIAGGTFTSANGQALYKADQTYTNAATFSVTGGTFSSDPSDFVAAGYEATHSGNVWTVDEIQGVAQIGETRYATLAAALAAATSGQTVTLLSNVETTAQFEVDKEMTLDLNGKTIQYTGTSTLASGVIMVLRGANLTITDSGSNGSILGGEMAYAAVALTKKGETSTADAQLTVKGGTLRGHYYAIVGNGNRQGTVITVNGGTLVGDEGSAIFHPQAGTLTITGGSLSGAETGVELRSGTLNISGGTFTATAAEYSCSPNGSGSTTTGAALAIAQHTTNQAITANITGGTFVGTKKLSIANPQDNAFNNVTVSGLNTLFGDSVVVPDGYIWSNNGDGTSSLFKPVTNWDGSSKEALTVVDADTYAIYSAAQLAQFAYNVNNGTNYAGKTVVLMNDIDLNNQAWTPISLGGNSADDDLSKETGCFLGTFDGNQKTISNLKVTHNNDDRSFAGLFGTITVTTAKTVTIKDVTVSGVDVNSEHMAAGILARYDGVSASAQLVIDGCSVVGTPSKNTITSTPFTNSQNKKESGNQAAGIVGCAFGKGGYTIQNCSVSGVTIQGTRDLGAIAGAFLPSGSSTFANNSASNCTITQVYPNDLESGKDMTAVHELVGRTPANWEVPASNTATNVTVNLQVPSVARIGDTYYTTLADAVTAAADGATIKVIKAGEYSIPAITKNLTFEATVSGVVVNHTSNSTAIATIASDKKAIFKNISFNLGNSYYHGFGTTNNNASGELEMDGCTIDGSLSLYGVSTLKNCTFTATNGNAGYYNIWAVLKDATFTNCTFTNTNRAVNVYDFKHTTNTKTVSFSGCTFTATGNEKKKAAINIHHNPDANKGYDAAKYNVSITNCTAAGSNWATSVAETDQDVDKTFCNSGLWMISDIVNWNAEIHVTVDGTPVQIIDQAYGGGQV